MFLLLFVIICVSLDCCLLLCTCPPHLAWQTWKKRKKIQKNVQVFQPFCVRDWPGFCIVVLLCPDMRRATRRMKAVMACVTLDEAIGQTLAGPSDCVCVWRGGMMLQSAQRASIWKMCSVAPGGNSVSSDGRTKFPWQTKPRHALRLMRLVKPRTQQEQKINK